MASGTWHNPGVFWEVGTSKSGTTFSITLPPAFRGVGYLFSTASNSMGIFLISVYDAGGGAAGNASVYPIGVGSNITFNTSAGNGVLKITNSAGNNCRIYLQPMNPDRPLP